MNAEVARSRSINLAFYPPHLYPPLLSTAPAESGFLTSVLPGDNVVYSLSVNGVPGTPQHVQLRAGEASGVVSVYPGFISSHTGSWSVELLLRASRGGVVIDEATLTLLDTRQLDVHRVDAWLSPNPAYLLEDEDQAVRTSAAFYDREGVKVPADEVNWSVTLPDNPAGVEVNGTSVILKPHASPGDIQVRIGEQRGVSRMMILNVLPLLDMDLHLGQYDLYPPIRETAGVSVPIRSSISSDPRLTYDYLLNGESGPHPGIEIRRISTDWELFFSTTFITSYKGQWPAEVAVQAFLDDQPVGKRTLKLHDTRTLVCTRIEVDLLPSATVERPEFGTAEVVAHPRLYDAQDIPIPPAEVTWDVAVENEPIKGIHREGNVLSVAPVADADTHRVSILGPGGVSGSTELIVK
ncbi:hypothetical protein [Stenotrophomonas sp.]|uniref:hypothetical protein n=1 Tax=Stenotrophomonas sp. TaxID=69392 RepID=UPI0028A6341C|nr:hypothetical protein [Stenotrophomonas sp.]